MRTLHQHIDGEWRGYLPAPKNLKSLEGIPAARQAIWRNVLFAGLAVVGVTLGFGIGSATAAEVHGNGDLGVWYLQNNIKNNSQIQDDGVGINHISSRYSVGRFGLRLDATDLTDGKSSYTLNGHFKGNILFRLTNSDYTLGFSERSRQEIDELNMEFQKMGGVVDIWLGRQLVYEAGGALFDGLRAIYKVSDHVDVAFYGGLDADPRWLSGYIGPSYEKKPFSLNFQTAGLYSTYRTDKSKTDAAFRSEFFKGSIDRVSLYSQSTYQLNAVWGFSGGLDADIAGKAAIRNINAYITSRPVPWVTNTLSFSRWRALQYKKSDVSAIPVITGVDASQVGDANVNESSYNSVREHIQFRIFQRNYIFTAAQFTRRTFDHLNQYKYTMGYRDPRLFGSSYDLRVQADLINNYRGFNTAFDAMLGKEWSEGIFRVETGATFYANERDTYVGFVRDASLPPQTDKEYSLRANVYYNPSQTISWLINYALHHEMDATNLNQNIDTHEVVLSTNFRF